MPINNLDTVRDKKVAKKDYKDFRRANPAGFNKSRERFRAEFIDKFTRASKRYGIHFNVKVTAMT